MRDIRLCTSLLLLAALALTGCSNNDTVTSSAPGTLRVRMTDAPAAIDAVHLNVIAVSAHRLSPSETDSTAGWHTLSSDSVTYDLFALRNGVFATIGEDLLPSGSYDQVRLLLGSGSTVVVDGVTHPLVVPSGMQSGVKIHVAIVVPPGGTTDVGLDFDAERSIHQTGNGTWMMSPVIRAFVLTQAGAIHGTALPAGAATRVGVVRTAGDTLAFTTPESSGAFTIPLLLPRTYSVAVDGAAGFRDTTITGVTVTAGHTTELGTFTLSPQ